MTARRRKPTPARLTHVATTTINDPRVDYSKLPPGAPVRQVVVADYIDDQNCRWRDWGDGELEFRGRGVPEVTREK